MSKVPSAFQPSRLYIGGEWIEPRSGATLDVENPTTERTVGIIADGDASDVDAAVEAASAARRGWRDRSPSDRADLLLRLERLIEANEHELAALDAIDSGKLTEHVGIATVMRQLVLVLAVATPPRRLARPFKGDDSRRVGLEGQVRQLQHDVEPHFAIVGRIGIRGELQSLLDDLRFRNVHPTFQPLDAPFGLTHGVQVFVQFALIGRAKISAQRIRVAEDFVQNAAPFGVALQCLRRGAAFRCGQMTAYSNARRRPCRCRTAAPARCEPEPG